MPLAVILGEDEQAQGQVKIKEMGLPEGHPEKDGVLVPLAELVPRVRAKLAALALSGADAQGRVDGGAGGAGAAAKPTIGGELRIRSKPPVEST